VIQDARGLKEVAGFLGMRTNGMTAEDQQTQSPKQAEEMPFEFSETKAQKCPYLIDSAAIQTSLTGWNLELGKQILVLRELEAA